MNSQLGLLTAMRKAFERPYPTIILSTTHISVNLVDNVQHIFAIEFFKPEVAFYIPISKLSLISTEHPNMKVHAEFFRNMSLLMLKKNRQGSHFLRTIFVVSDVITPCLAPMDLGPLKMTTVEMIKGPHPALTRQRE